MSREWDYYRYPWGKVFPNFQSIGAIYNGVYTTSIIISVGLNQHALVKLSEKSKTLKDELTKLRKELY